MDTNTNANIDINININDNKPTINNIKATIPDIIFAIEILILGYLYFRFHVFSGIGGFGVTAYTVLLTVVTYIYMKNSGYDQTADSLFYMVILLIFGMGFSVFSGETEKSIGIVSIQLIYVYWVAKTTGRLLNKRPDKYLYSDIIYQLICVPFEKFASLAEVLCDGYKNDKKRKSFIMILLGILCAIPVLAIVILLLSSADAIFGQVSNSIFGKISNNVFEKIIMLICGVPTAFYIFALVYNDIHPERLHEYSVSVVDAKRSKKKIIPYEILTTMVMLLDVIYILFAVLQVSNLFMAFYDKLPSGMTYAEYARGGFFQLVWVAVINLIVTVIAITLVRENNGKRPTILSCALSLLSILTIFLGMTALRKMYLYICVYGLTKNRLITSIFIMYLILVFLLLTFGYFRKIKYREVILMSGAIIIAAFIMFGNTDGIIARYNISRIKDGTLESDCMFDSDKRPDLSIGAMDAYNEVLNKEDINVSAETTKNIMKEIYFREVGYDRKNIQWYDQSIAIIRAGKMIGR